VRVRQASTADIAAIMHLERQSPSAGHWSQNQYEALFSIPGGRQRSERFALLAEDHGGAEPEEVSHATSGVLAFLIAHRVDAEWELENIVVAENARRRGVAMRLLGEFIEHVRAQQGAAVFLEVRESNQGARALYRKAGFTETGLRKSYYSNPPEDAILCRLCFY
jgi:[ribosomal protein S18]-alanine N-acetyltransferase